MTHEQMVLEMLDDPMTPEELAELRRLHDAATAATWHQGPYYKCDVHSPNQKRDRDYVLKGRSFYPCDERDAALIVAARNALPRLLDRIDELTAENERLRLRLLSAAGDDLCRLSQDEINAMSAGTVKIPPKEEFLASCERFHSQIAKESGVLEGCLTLAQLIAENERLRAENTRLRNNMAESIAARENRE